MKLYYLSITFIIIHCFIPTFTHSWFSSRWHWLELRTIWKSIFLSISESPVPLEFTPVLGILVGVVLTLMLVAFVVILVLRLKYQTNKAKNTDRANNRKQNQHQQNNKNKQERTKANNTTSIPDDKDAEEYYCMSLANENSGNKSDTLSSSNKNISNSRRQVAMLKSSSKHANENQLISNELNPDVIPNRHKAQVVSQINHPKSNSSGK